MERWSWRRGPTGKGGTSWFETRASVSRTTGVPVFSSPASRPRPGAPALDSSCAARWWSRRVASSCSGRTPAGDPRSKQCSPVLQEPCMGSAATRILVVEDDPTSARFLALVLAELGHEVQHAADGLDALLSLEKSRTDLVLTDLRMPRLGGLELLGFVRERWPGLPVIVISVDEDIETIVS